uniref:DDE-1 domain-containing protein n=1 Tax=Strongyloides stercoralis TaxID=6248 RepID=A0AAF5I336_STRER
MKKNGDKIRKTVEDGCLIGAKRVTRTRNSIMVKKEKALMIWIEDCITKKIPMSGNLIKQKAIKIYEHIKNSENIVLDNAGCHKIKLEHPNVKIIFLPPNCISLIQPLDQGIIQTFKLYYTRQLFQTIFDRLESSVEKSLTQVWSEITILDCIKTVSSACEEIKPSTLNACWKPLLLQMVQAMQDEFTISLPITEIVNTASQLSDEEFLVSHQEVRDLVLEKETLDEVELMELIDASTSNALVNENVENEKGANFYLHYVKKGLNLVKKLELHFIHIDHSTVQSSKFKRELRNCLAP